MPYFGRRVGGSGGQSDPGENGQVEQIVPHERDVAVFEPELGEQPFVRGQLVERALTDDRDAELIGPLGCRRRLARRQQPDTNARFLCQDDTRSVADVKVLDSVPSA